MGLILSVLCFGVSVEAFAVAIENPSKRSRTLFVGSVAFVLAVFSGIRLFSTEVEIYET